MIDGNFYTIVARHESDPLHIRCDVEFNVDHEIFKAHFPGNPIVPGVCSLEIIRQMATALLGGVIRIPSVKNMKFINVMTPAKGKLFTFDIQLVAQSDSQYSAKATISDADAIVVKASLLCEKH
ncbi:MAG: hypothetical protein J6Z26_08005 [Bacteroidales bacterium]|nr:hypothetical protein [Bacteroidales bacterium]